MNCGWWSGRRWSVVYVLCRGMRHNTETDTVERYVVDSTVQAVHAAVQLQERTPRFP